MIYLYIFTPGNGRVILPFYKGFYFREIPKFEKIKPSPKVINLQYILAIISALSYVLFLLYVGKLGRN